MDVNGAAQHVIEAVDHTHENTDCPLLAGRGGPNQTASTLAMPLFVQPSPRHHLPLSRGI